MECLTLLLLISFLLLCLFIFISFLHYHRPKLGKLPPGPRPFPIIGNILELGTKPHHALTRLSKIHGPLMTLKLGTITTVVISSPDIAKEALQQNDIVFSGRTVPHAAHAQDHHKFSIGFMPPSAKWRVLRRACATNIFSSQQLHSTQILRRNKVQDLLDYVHECCRKSEALDIGEAVFTTILNSLSNTFFSMDFAGFSSDSSQEFMGIISGALQETGRPNVADFFPILRLCDPQGVYARMDNYTRRFLSFIDSIIEERIKIRDSNMEPKVYKDVLDSFLSLIEEENSQLNRVDVLHLFADLLVAGVDTTSITIEWAMVELLRNQEKMRKAREELRQVLGNINNEIIEESQVTELAFLRAVVKETLRLHPPVPFLVPHKAQDNAELSGFTVPKNAQVLVNLWAVGRDSSLWENPDLFMPERFLESEIDFKGRDFVLIPFGAGRRICPGLPLGSRSIHLILASLLYDFEWKLADGLTPETMDMEEKFGVTLRRVQPLRAIPLVKAAG